MGFNRNYPTVSVLKYCLPLNSTTSNGTVSPEMLTGRTLVLDMLGGTTFGYNHAHFFNDFLSTSGSWITCIFTGLLYAFMFGYMLVNFADTFSWFVLVFM
jgi:hypothetical protein